MTIAGGQTAQQAWARAALRALAADLPHRLRERGAAVLVPSCAEDGRVYHVALVGGRVGQCDCPAGVAGRGGSACKHRAAVALRLWEKATGLRLVGVKAVDEAILGRYLRPPSPAPAPANVLPFARRAA